MARAEAAKPAYPVAAAFDEWLGRLIAVGGLAMGAIGFVWGVAFDNSHWLKWELAGIGLILLAAGLFMDAAAIEGYHGKARFFGWLREPVQAVLGRLLGLGGLVMGAIGFVWGVAFDNSHWLKWELAGIGLILLALAMFADAIITERREVRTA